MRTDEVQDLREQRKRVHNQMLELNAKAEKEKRDLTAEEVEQYDKMLEDFEGLEKRVRRSSQLAAQQREIKEENQRVYLPEGQKAPDNLSEYRSLAGVQLDDRDDPEYRQAFYHWLTSANPTVDLEVEEQRVMSKATAGAGGNVVPTSMYDEIIRSLRWQGSVGSLAKVITTGSGDTLNVPSNPTHGTAAWTAENVAFTASDEVFGTLAYSAYKAATTIIVSEELLEDSAFPLDSFLATEFGERIRALEESAFVLSDGTGKPKGLLTTNATTDLTLSTAAVGNSTSFTYAAIVTAMFALPSQYRENASFIVNDANARNLYLMVDSQGRPLWNVNMAAGGPDTFLGKPIYTHPDVPAPAISVVSLLYGDWSRAYMIRRVDGFHMQRLMELYANTGQIGFRGWERVDGKVILGAAGIALKHSAT
jgi:HK97 family phage major capsid protein